MVPRLFGIKVSRDINRGRIRSAKTIAYRIGELIVHVVGIAVVQVGAVIANRDAARAGTDAGQ